MQLCFQLIPAYLFFVFCHFIFFFCFQVNVLLICSFLVSVHHQHSCTAASEPSEPSDPSRTELEIRDRRSWCLSGSHLSHREAGIAAAGCRLSAAIPALADDWEVGGGAQVRPASPPCRCCSSQRHRGTKGLKAHSRSGTPAEAQSRLHSASLLSAVATEQRPDSLQCGT